MRGKNKKIHYPVLQFSTNKNQVTWKAFAIHRCNIKTDFITSFLKSEPNFKKRVFIHFT